MGKQPYGKEKLKHTLGQVIVGKRRPTIPDDCDSRWKALMCRCWAPHPADRPSFSEICAELEAMLKAGPELRQASLGRSG